MPGRSPGLPGAAPGAPAQPGPGCGAGPGPTGPGPGPATLPAPGSHTPLTTHSRALAKLTACSPDSD
ncbi:hypothetical protein DRB89_17810 [Streptomyces sp. ICC4]|nr:hypothetical protein DRB89_17810 [Streptomyces sp. ICC4]